MAARNSKSTQSAEEVLAAVLESDGSDNESLDYLSDDEMSADDFETKDAKKCSYQPVDIPITVVPDPCERDSLLLHDVSQTIYCLLNDKFTYSCKYGLSF